ncbi:zinc finger protein [Acrasis kona]|uniref:Zinc finger protein n=1 Tax=Acrasis kona TaxID=1008807 RepID=A0AAW2ZLA7_9EUKA
MTKSDIYHSLPLLLMAVEQMEPQIFHAEVHNECTEHKDSHSNDSDYMEDIKAQVTSSEDEEVPPSPREEQENFDEDYEDEYHVQKNSHSKKRKADTLKSRKNSRVEWTIEAEPQQCPFNCGRAYTSTIGMKSHLKRFHINEQETNFDWTLPDLRFQCPYCEYHSNRRSNLERHLNRYHIEDYRQGVIPNKNRKNPANALKSRGQEPNGLLDNDDTVEFVADTPSVKRRRHEHNKTTHQETSLA